MSGPIEQADRIERAVVARWHEQVSSLVRTLETDPDGPWAWLWAIRIKVYEYLLKRYDAGGPIDPDDLPLVIAASRDAKPEITRPRPIFTTARKSGVHKSPNPRPIFRDRLQRIAECNAERHARNEQLRTHPRWYGALTYDEYDELAKLIRIRQYNELSDEPFTQEEIAEIIFGEHGDTSD
ncbi:MAG: hypothetical protein AAF333_14040 [Planctomycetota bacterium]